MWHNTLLRRGGWLAIVLLITQGRSFAAAASESLVRLGGQAGLPAFLAADPNVLADADGMRGGDLRTRATDLADKDFSFDVLLQFQADDRECVIGFGDGARDGNWMPGSVVAHLGGPRSDGASMLMIGRQRADLGKLPSGSGPHLVRLEKKGDALTFSVTPNYQGTWKPAIFKTLPNLRMAAPFLDVRTSAVFLSGQATFDAVSLTVDGKLITASTLPADRVELAPASAPATVPVLDARRPGPLFRLAGNAGLPTYLRVTPQTLADEVGLRGGVVTTAVADLVDHDFTIDMLYQWAPEDKELFIGLGEDGSDGGNWIVNSVYARLDSGTTREGNVNLAISRSGGVGVGKIGRDPGPHLFRIEKKGQTLTFAIWADYKEDAEPSAPTLVRTWPDLKTTAPFLNSRNSSVFFHGEGSLVAIRYARDGKPVESGLPVAPAKARSEGPGKFLPLGGPAGLPSFLKTTPQTLASEEGLRGGVLCTARSDLAVHDFILDVLYQSQSEDREFSAGIGEDGSDGGNWILNSVYAGIESTTRGQGAVSLRVGRDWGVGIGKLGKGAGANLLRIEKKANTLTFAVAADYHDDEKPFVPTLSRTFPDLKAVAQFLTRLNSGIFMHGDVTWLAARFVLDGVSIDGKASDEKPKSVTRSGSSSEAPTAAARPTEGADESIGRVEPMSSLAGSAGLPDVLHGAADTLATPEGLQGGTVRSTSSDLIDHDFTFDLLFRWKPGDRSLRVGVGENASDGSARAVNTVMVEVASPAADGAVSIFMSTAGSIGVGKLGRGEGPHLLRVQKHGKTLTFSIAADWKDGPVGGPFAPEVTRTIPDLPATAPFLTKLNSGLFVTGDAIWMAMRLSIDDATPAALHNDRGPSNWPGLGSASGPATIIQLPVWVIIVAGTWATVITAISLVTAFRQQRAARMLKPREALTSSANPPSPANNR